MRVCHICQYNKAKIHFYHDNLIKSVCDKCLENIGLNAESNEDISEIFRALNDILATPSEVSHPQQHCECGRSVVEFLTQMKAGCTQCYKTFDSVVDIVLNTTGSDEEDEVSTVMKPLLEVQLSEAIKDERYEDAADIRDLMEDKSDQA